MNAFIELQKNINQSYADIRYDGQVARLTRDEKKQLELFFKIEKGSTSVSVDIAKIIETLIQKMPPETFVLAQT